MPEKGKIPEPFIKHGNIKRRDKSLVKVAEALGDVLTPEILSIADMSGYPDLQRESERNQVIMCAIACGFSQRFIGNALGIAGRTVCEIVNRIDPDKKFRVTKDARKAFLTQMYEARGLEALASITPEKLDESSASDLARISKTMADAISGLNATKHSGVISSKLDAMMEAAVAEVTEAEFTEV